MKKLKNIEYWPLDRLRPYARNPRTHSQDQVAQIAASIVEYGWTNPVLAASDGTVIAGHGRLEAARKLGLAAVPVLVLDHLTAAKRRAYVIADNKIALNAGWDDAMLSAELTALNVEGFDLALTGFDVGEIDRLLDGLDDGTVADTGEDVAPKPPVDAITRPGDLWLLAKHRLLCGDSTLKADVEKLLAGARPHLMVTDPPYGVEYDIAWRNETGVNVNQSPRTGKVKNDDRADWRGAWALFPGEVAYVWHSSLHSRTVVESLEACGFVVRSQIVWAKPNFAISRGDYHWQHEPCFYAVRKGGTGHWQGARDQSTVWNIGQGTEENAATVHGTQKPVECMRRPLINNSERGDSVYEPFAGSGTALVAAESIGRNCLAMEIDPRYCDVAVRRWETYTGGAASLYGDGRGFADISAERRQTMTGTNDR